MSEVNLLPSSDEDEEIARRIWAEEIVYREVDPRDMELSEDDLADIPF